LCTMRRSTFAFFEPPAAARSLTRKRWADYESDDGETGSGFAGESTSAEHSHGLEKILMSEEQLSREDVHKKLSVWRIKKRANALQTRQVLQCIVDEIGCTRSARPMGFQGPWCLAHLGVGQLQTLAQQIRKDLAAWQKFQKYAGKHHQGLTEVRWMHYYVIADEDFLDALLQKFGTSSLECMWSGSLVKTELSVPRPLTDVEILTVSSVLLVLSATIVFCQLSCQLEQVEGEMQMIERILCRAQIGSGECGADASEMQFLARIMHHARVSLEDCKSEVLAKRMQVHKMLDVATSCTFFRCISKGSRAEGNETQTCAGGERVLRIEHTAGSSRCSVDRW